MRESVIMTDNSRLHYSKGALLLSALKVKAILLAVFGFLFSYVLSPYYYGGDQKFYRLLYDNIKSYDSLADKFSYYKVVVDATEPVYLLVINFVSDLIDKDLFFSAINGGILGVVSLFFLRNKRGFLFCALFIFNYYFVVLGFSAERLKMGALFFSVALLFNGYKRYFVVLLACLCQFQFIVLAAALIIFNASDAGARVDNKKIFGVTFFVFIIVIALSRLDYSIAILHLAGKFEIYEDAGWGGAAELLKPAVFMLGALFCRKDKARVAMVFAPILMAAYLFGSERFAIFGYFLMMYFLAHSSARNNFVVIPTMIYFCYGGFRFILGFIENGQV